MNCPTIKVQVHQEKAFRYLWLKYVHGFNPDHHCARGLIGPYSKRFPYSRGYVPPQLIEGALDEHPGPWFYLCGVTSRWEWNVHVAGTYEPGSIVTHQDERISVEIVGLKRLAIDASHSPPAPRDFATCRNWQFGWQAFPNTRRSAAQPTLFE